MLIDIVRMPPVFGLPIDRRQVITSDVDHAVIAPNSVVWQGVPIYQSRLNVGSLIEKVPAQVYKATYLSDDFTTIVEVVFSTEEVGAICLYAKVISSEGSWIGVSTPAVQFYQNSSRHVFPLSHFLISNRLPGVDSVIRTPLVRTSPVENVVPPIFSLNTLQMLFQEAMQSGIGVVDYNLSAPYRAIHQHFPHIMEAVITGRFLKPPFAEFVERSPYINVNHDQWFTSEQFKYNMVSCGLKIELYHPFFDDIALHLMCMPPTAFTTTMLISSAIKGLNEIRYPTHFEDPYYPVTRRSFSDNRSWMAKVLYDAVMAYCRIYQIDSNEFLTKDNDRSLITVGRNSYDEVKVIFHDQLTNQYVGFYSGFPALSMTTLSVGWYH